MVTSRKATDLPVSAIPFIGPVYAFNKQLDGNVFNTIDQKFDLFPVVRQSDTDTRSKRFYTLDTASPFRKSIVGCNDP